MPITVNIKLSGKKYSAEVEVAWTVLELKENLVAVVDLPANQMRLVYKGRVLKDGDTLDSYGVEDNHTIHMVKGAAAKPAGTPTSAPAAAPTPAPAPAPAPTSSMPSMGGGFGGLGGMGGMGMGGNLNANMADMQRQLQQNPQLMQDIMNSPMMQNVMNNPDIMRNVMQSNPQMRQMMENNPQLNHVLNDPELLRQTMEAARNPDHMRHLMQQQDRALSNIEAHPGGFNALARMYTDVQEPMMQASASSSTSPPNPFATAPAPAATGVPNSAALPNPWAAPAPAAPGPAAARTGANPFAGLSGVGGMGGMGGMDPASMSAMLENPAVQSMMQNMMQNPAMIDSMVAGNPMLRQMMDANPQLRSMMQNPELMRQAMNPANVQAMLQMQQSMQQLQSSGLMPPMGGQANPFAPPGTTATGNSANGTAAPFDMSALLASMQAPTGGTATTPVAPPEERFASQLEQLKDMGFYDESQNIRALTATNGNVNAAVERILGGI